MVEMEGGEGVVNKRSMSSQDTFEFEGEGFDHLRNRERTESAKR